MLALVLVGVHVVAAAAAAADGRCLVIESLERETPLDDVVVGAAIELVRKLQGDERACALLLLVLVRGQVSVRMLAWQATYLAVVQCQHLSHEFNKM